MKNKKMILMAVILAVATAATTMTAFAEPEKKKKNHQISEQVTDSIQATSQAILRLKVRQARTVPDNYQPPSITLAKPKLN